MSEYQKFDAPQPQPQDGQPQRKSHKKWWWIGGIAVAAVIVGSVSAGAGDDDTPMATPAPAPVTAADVGGDAAPAPAPEPQPTTPAAPRTSGKLKVGTDIAPGAYRAEPVRGTGYLARCSDRNCGLGDGLIDNYLFTGPDYVDILPTDAFVEVNGVRLIPDN